MATIRPNDNAPADSVNYIFPLETFELAAGGSYETENQNTISAAVSHPWLEVEYPEMPELSVADVVRGVPYEKDVLAAPNSLAFNADAVRQAIEERKREADSHTALDAGLDQGEPVETGGVAETLAADAAQDDDDDKEGDE
jgi:hypothetical protein